MSERATGRHEQNWIRHVGSRLVSLLVVTALAVGPAFTTGSLLRHAHGHEGQHEHVLSALIAAHHEHALHDAHAAQHGIEAHDGHECAVHEGIPIGTLAQLPAPSLFRRDRVSSAPDFAPILSWAQPPSIPGARLLCALGPPGVGGDAGPLQRGEASGAVRVLRSSHALLI